jgi:H+/Cl- antiporter ClcA
MAAGVGMAAMFGVAANTPIALSVMAVELLGTAVLPHVLLVSLVAYLVTGHRGIYPSQRVRRYKHGASANHPDLRLADVHAHVRKLDAERDRT